MSNHESYPREVAAKYRVKKDEDGKFQICSEQCSPVALCHNGIDLNFEMTLNAVRWNAPPIDNVVYVIGNLGYFIELTVAKLEIGYKSTSSALVDNCFFGIDGETLRYLPITKLNIVSEEQLIARESESASNKGLEFIPKTNWNNGFGRGTIYYSDFDQSVNCYIGLPQAHFQQLLDGCLSKSISRVYFSGCGGALSSSWVSEYQPGEVRDAILLADEEFNFGINWLNLEYCGKQDEKEIEEKPRNPSETEWKILVALERVISSIEALRSTVIKTSCILLAALIIATLIK